MIRWFRAVKVTLVVLAAALLSGTTAVDRRPRHRPPVLRHSGRGRRSSASRRRVERRLVSDDHAARALRRARSRRRGGANSDPAALEALRSRFARSRWRILAATGPMVRPVRSDSLPGRPDADCGDDATSDGRSDPVAQWRASSTSSASCGAIRNCRQRCGQAPTVGMPSLKRDDACGGDRWSADLQAADLGALNAAGSVAQEYFNRVAHRLRSRCAADPRRPHAPQISARICAWPPGTLGWQYRKAAFDLNRQCVRSAVAVRDTASGCA